MNENEQPISEPATPDGRFGSGGGSQPTSGPSLGEVPSDIGIPPPPPPWWMAAPGQWPSTPLPPQATRGRQFPRLLEPDGGLGRCRCCLRVPFVGLSIVVATTPSATTARSPANRVPAGGLVPGGGPFAGRFGAGLGGASGTVNSVAASSFTMTTTGGPGQKMTADELSSTTYRNGASSASASAVISGGLCPCVWLDERIDDKSDTGHCAPDSALGDSDSPDFQRPPSYRAAGGAD